MLEIKYVKENIALIKKTLGKRGSALDFDAFTQAEKKRRELLQEIETLRHQRNVVSDDIATMKKYGQILEAQKEGAFFNYSLNETENNEEKAEV